MPRATPEVLALRLSKALSRKAQWRQLYDDAMRLSMPNRNTFTQTSRGGRKDDLVYDSTLSLSRTRFANRLQSELFPIFQKWADLVPGQFIRVSPQQLKKLKSDLREIRDVMFAVISVSNFDSVINEFLQDLGLGTGVLLVLEGDDAVPIRFVAVPLSQIALEEGPWGSVGAVFHTQKVPQGLLDSMYSNSIFKEDPKPEGWDKTISDAPQDEIEVTAITYSDFVRNAGGGFDWFYDVYAKVDVSGIQSKPQDLGVRIVSDQFDDNPWIIGRWSKLPGEDFGRGPIIEALPDAKTLNKVVELVLKNAALAISPPLTAVDDGSWNLNIAVIRPNVVIPVASNASAGARGPSLKALELPSRFDVANLVIENLIAKIKKAMLDDQLPAEEGSIRSPTEIVERVRQLQQDIGSPFGRLHSEVLRLLVQRILNVLIKSGVLKIPGVDRVNVDGSGVEVRAVSKLARVQNLSEIEAAAQWIELQQMLGERAVELNVNTEGWGQWTADKLSVAPEVVRSEEDQQRMLDQMRQAEAAAAAPSQGADVQPPAQETLPVAA